MIAISTIMGKQDVDSPVYTFLPDLQPPSVEAVRRACGLPASPPPAGSAAPTAEAPAASEKFSPLLDPFREAKKEGDFFLARKYLEKLREIKPRRSVSDPAACTGDLQEQAAERA